MQRLLVMCVMLVYTAMAHAGTTAGDYAADKATVDNAKAALTDAGQHFNPQSSLPGYNPHPAAENDYHGITGGDGDIQKKARQQLSRDKAGGTVYKDFTTRPKIKINKNSADFADSTLAKNDSYNITHGISDQYINCQQHATCKTVMTDVHCTRTNTVTVHCTKVPVVRVTTDPYLKPIPKPCTHIVIINDHQAVPTGATKLGSFYTSTGSGSDVYHVIARFAVYAVLGESATQGCYIPNTFHIEHDRNQHGSTAFTGFADATYTFHARAFYYANQGVGDLTVRGDGVVVAHIQAASNAGDVITLLYAKKASRYVLDGYNRGFNDDYYYGAWSVYWASTPLKQTHQKAHVTWNEDCGGSHA